MKKALKTLAWIVLTLSLLALVLSLVWLAKCGFDNVCSTPGLILQWGGSAANQYIIFVWLTIISIILLIVLKIWGNKNG